MEKNYENDFNRITGLNFNEFYAEYYIRLKKYISKFKITDTDADEITSIAFMKSLEKIDSFNPQYTYKTWLFTIAKRLALQYKIDAKKIINIDINESSQNESLDYHNRSILVSQNADDSDDIAEYEAHVNMRYEVTLNEISKLDIKYKRYLELYNIEGKSYNDIVDIMGVSLQTVKNRLHYGRNKIAKIVNATIPTFIA